MMKSINENKGRFYDSYADAGMKPFYFIGRLLLILLIAFVISPLIYSALYSFCSNFTATVLNVRLYEVFGYPELHHNENLGSTFEGIVFCTMAQILLIVIYALILIYENKQIKKTLCTKLMENPQAAAERFLKMEKAETYDKRKKVFLIVLKVVVCIAAIAGSVALTYYSITHNVYVSPTLDGASEEVIFHYYDVSFKRAVNGALEAISIAVNALFAGIWISLRSKRNRLNAL